MADQTPLVAVMGQTASGKTALAESLAQRLDAILLNADAFQVYRGMSIGTSKPEKTEKYKLLDLKNPDEQFGLGEWLRLALEHLERAFRDRQAVVIVGGTGLYIRALFEEYQEIFAAPNEGLRQELMTREESEGLEVLARELKIRQPNLPDSFDFQNSNRVRRSLEKLQGPAASKVVLPPFKKKKFAISATNEWIDERIAERLSAMLQNGWLAEVKDLCHRGYKPGDPGFKAIGYSILYEAVVEQKELQAAAEQILLDTRRYAKRQRTWLRSEPHLTMLERDSLESLSEKALREITLF